MIEQAVNSLLRDDDTISDFVGTRVRPLLGAQNDLRPHIVYSIETESIPTYTGRSSFSRSTVTISSCADTYKECAELAAAVRDLLDGYSGTSEDERIVPSLLQSETEVQEGVEPGTEKPVYVRTQEYRMLHLSVA